MKNLLKISALAAVLVASATFASADTIQLGSYATGQSALGNANTALSFTGFVAGINTGPATVFAPSNTGSASTFTLSPAGVWIDPLAGSTYVGSTATSGPGPLTQNPAFGYYTFSTTFAATGTYSGSISILADDTTAVFLNGVQIVPFGALGGNVKCADGTPNCTVLSTFSLAGLSLTGTNSLQFVVRQAGDGATALDPSGLDFRATLTTVPEPNTLLMLGTGLMGSAGMLFRRMRS